MSTSIVLAAQSASLLSSFRKLAINNGGELAVPIAIELAIIFAIIRIVKIAHDVMSDEQNAGYGGVQLKDLYKPILIFILVVSSTSVIAAYDNILSYITNSMSNSMIPSQAVWESTSKILQNAELTDQISEQQWKEMGKKDQVDVLTKEYESSRIGQENIRLANELTQKLNTLDPNSTDYQEIKAKRDALYTSKTIDAPKKLQNRKGEWVNHPWLKYKRESTYIDEWREGLSKLIRNYHNLETESSIVGLIVSSTSWAYDQAYTIMNAFADIMLSVLAVLFPFIAAMALLPPLESGLLNFLTSYAQLSFWKVILSIINWVIATGAKSISQLAQSQNTSIITDYMQGKISPDMVNTIQASSAAWATFLLIAAGLLSFLAVPSISSAIIQSGAHFGEVGTSASNMMRGGVTSGRDLVGKGISGSWNLLKGKR